MYLKLRFAILSVPLHFLMGGGKGEGVGEGIGGRLDSFLII